MKKKKTSEHLFKKTCEYILNLFENQRYIIYFFEPFISDFTYTNKKYIYSISYLKIQSFDALEDSDGGDDDDRRRMFQSNLWLCWKHFVYYWHFPLHILKRVL